MKSSKKRILTGDRTSGPLHIGHYIGSLAERVKLQDEYETYILLADVQALTDNFDNPGKVREAVREVYLDNIAVGLDPEKVIFHIQSLIPQTAELTIFFANLVSMEKLGHNPTVKTELKQKTQFKDSTPLGFFMYPVSQAADITIVRGDLVPVGEDQLPHIEQTQELVKKFNSMYGEVFPIPKAKLTKMSRLVGTDGNAKMSKSLNNSIYLKDDSETVKKKIMSMYTDPSRIRATDPGKVEGNPVFIYHDSFNEDKAEVEDLKERYKKGAVGDVEVKEKLFIALEKILTPIRERRKEYDALGTKLDQMLLESTRIARKEAEITMGMVREAMKIDYDNPYN
jgi:tryptophanyl-tRNA synthetase